MSVTTKDLAEICGVSRTTVIRALHGTGRISAQTKQRILETAGRLGYEPDLAARSLVLGKSMMIGVVVVDLRNLYFPKIVDAIGRRVLEDDYILNITIHEDNKEAERKLIRMLTGHRVDGLILNPINKGEAFYEMMKKVKVPYCILGIDEFAGCAAVGVDEEAAGADAARYILEKGYRNSAFVVPPLYDADGVLNLGHHRRLKGFISVMENSGCSYHVIYDKDGRPGYLQQTLALVREAGRENKLALLCSGAMFAMDIVGAVRQHGSYAPEDYGIMAFDGIEEYQSWSPRLTSLDNHVEKMGFEAGDLVIRMIRGEASERRIVIPHNIVEGQTL